MPLKLTIRLKKGVSNNLSIGKLKKIVEKEKTLSPGLKKLLKGLRKAKQSSIQLANIKEIIVVFEKYLNLERIVDPPQGGYMNVNWEQDEIESYEKDKKKHLKNIFELYEDLGYEFLEPEEMEMKQVEELIKLTKPFEVKKT